jgi:hypothetical protein
MNWMSAICEELWVWFPGYSANPEYRISLIEVLLVDPIRGEPFLVLRVADRWICV